ncbi:hypothetical protein Taro_006163 [Colocasia esculenta]|uniref:Prolamin-like domain-containing protein n=1 Tax=Colocasia esculenta TaxID=4460 RepID=A0A843TQC9_COLES|nr:hypothetical protein [Colocasia esculenta]
MRKANGLLSMLLLLLACAATRCPASYATSTEEVHPETDDIKLLVPGFQWWSSIIPIIGDPKIQECWRSLLGSEISCVTSALQSILAGRFALSSKCCAAVAALGDSCVPRMFSFLPQSNLIPGLINSVCATFAPPTVPAGPPSPARGF